MIHYISPMPSGKLIFRGVLLGLGGLAAGILLAAFGLVQP